ncbi:MAG: PGN_0703 family putative restriction endonuclease [Anaerolineae bacterium]
MYVHLINWKWSNITREPGYSRGIPYDAILPDEYKAQFYPLYRPIVTPFLEHQHNFPFKSHHYLGHMASSQAACANLFLPILQDPQIAARVLSVIKPDLNKIATDYLDHGFRLEFWDEPENALNDHNKTTGTDADIAIAYYDHHGELNLWLIEHKLTEPEFTVCGGFKSPKRKRPFACEPASAIIDDNSLCYYHGKCGYRYWDITLQANWLFQVERMREYKVCPFKGGMNQLWRNQLLATALESSTSAMWPYKKVYFSVVYHPRNESLLPTIAEYQNLIDSNDRFSVFSSAELLDRAFEVNEPQLNDWVRWYQDLYYY